MRETEVSEGPQRSRAGAAAAGTETRGRRRSRSKVRAEGQRRRRSKGPLSMARGDSISLGSYKRTPPKCNPRLGNHVEPAVSLKTAQTTKLSPKGGDLYRRIRKSLKRTPIEDAINYSAGGPVAGGDAVIIKVDKRWLITMQSYLEESMDRENERAKRIRQDELDRQMDPQREEIKHILEVLQRLKIEEAALKDEESAFLAKELEDSAFMAMGLYNTSKLNHRALRPRMNGPGCLKSHPFNNTGAFTTPPPSRKFSTTNAIDEAGEEHSEEKKPDCASCARTSFEEVEIDFALYSTETNSLAGGVSPRSRSDSDDSTYVCSSSGISSSSPVSCRKPHSRVNKTYRGTSSSSGNNSGGSSAGKLFPKETESR